MVNIPLLLKKITIYEAEVLVAKNALVIHYDLHALCFDFDSNQISISDLYETKKWKTIRTNFKRKDIQPIINFYYIKYNKLKVFL